MNWLRTVLGALVAILVAVGIAVPLTTHLAPVTGRQVFAVRGASMAPAIPMGALIVVADHGTDDLAAGDVVTWRGDNGVWVTHRIVQVVDEGGQLMFQTKGDANATPDGFVVPARAVIGSVEFWIPVAGFALMILATPAGVISWLSFALGLLVADSLLGGRADGRTWPRLDWPSRRRAAATRDARERSATSAAVLARLHRSTRPVATLEPSADAAEPAGWPIHFEGVTLFGDDPVLLDDMTRCAGGDHSGCITDVRPRACLIGVEAWSAPGRAGEPGAARSLSVRTPSAPEGAMGDEAVAWVSREVSRAAA